MLPTNEKANSIWSNSLLNKLSYGELSPIHCSHYHLYILSDEEIKEGDWCIMLDSFGNVFSNPRQYTNPETQFLNKGLRKIIATTDSSLKIEKSSTGYTENRSRTFYSLESLPQPSKSFIEVFVEEYNKGNIITDVMVEYEQNLICENVFDNNSVSKQWVNKGVKSKINPDNIINIKPIISESEVIGEKIVEYCKQYEGTNKYNDVLKAIEFGYQLSIDKNL